MAAVVTPGGGAAARRTDPRVLAWVLAALIALPLADSLFQIPIQVSDSLEPIVISARYNSAARLLADSLHFSATTLRPMRYLQAKALLNAAEAAHVSYNTVFRGVHVLVLLAMVALFVTVVGVHDGIDLAAFAVAFPVFVGMHTFVAMLQESFPVNHYAEVTAAVLAVFALAVHRPSWFTAPAGCLLLVLGLSVVESGALVWVAIVACAAVGLRGITRGTLISTTVLMVGYFAVRHALEITSPGIGSHSSGIGTTFYSAEELAQRYSAHPLPLVAYNIAGGLASLLFAEPRQGVYSLAVAWRAGEIHPVVAINVLSSAVMTALLVWYAATRLRAGRAHWTGRERLFAAAAVIMIVNGALTAAYIKDEIISPAGACYAVASFVAVDAMLRSLPRRGLAAASALALLLATTAALWTCRAAGAHYILRYAAFKTRNDWVEVLREDRREDWPADARERLLTARLREEALARRVASPSFMPRWADRYWVE